MNSFHISVSVLVTAVLITLAGCSKSMVISDVNYSQPIESVLVPSNKGVVEDIQHGISFNILPLQYAETGDSTSVTTTQIRMIRGREGFYYITAPGYSNVYVMQPKEGSLVLQNKIKINEEGIAEPAFNQRDSFIQLLNRQTNETYLLTSQGIENPETNSETQTAQETGL